MKTEINNDNKFKIGSLVSAKADPSLKLTILNYRQRIYYCAAADDLSLNNFAYFEKELMAP